MQLLTALRDETTHLHTTLDTLVSRQPLTTRSGYLRFLRLNARLLPTVESWLMSTKVFSTLPNHRERLRAQSLGRDLTALGEAMPEPASMSFLNEDSSVLGICYVVEGSRLGSAHLCNLLEKAGSDVPTAFLRHGRGSGFWRSFLIWLSEQDQSALAVRRAAASARHMFDAYLRALEDYDRNH